MHIHFLNQELGMHCSLLYWWRYCPLDKQLWTPETWADCIWGCRLSLGWWSVEKSTGVYNTNECYVYTTLWYSLTWFWQRGELQLGNARRILLKLRKLSQPSKWSSWIILVLFHFPHCHSPFQCERQVTWQELKSLRSWRKTHSDLGLQRVLLRRPNKSNNEKVLSPFHLIKMFFIKYRIKNWQEKEKAMESFLNLLIKDCDEWNEISQKSHEGHKE